MKEKIILSWILLFSVNFAFNLSILMAQSSIKDLSFKKIDASDGLSSNETKKVFRDSEGYLWVFAEGVFNKYDGYSFTRYPVLEDNTSWKGLTVYDISESSDQEILLATSHGMVTLKKEFDHFAFVALNTDQEKQPIKKLITDKNNAIWAIGNRIFRYDKKGEFLPLTESITNETVTSAAYDEANHQILVGTGAGKIFFYNILNNQLTDSIIPEQPLLSGNIQKQGIRDMYFEKATGILWTAVASGDLKKIDTKNHVTETINLSDTLEQGNHITTLFNYNDTSLWVGTATEGILVINKNFNTVDAWFTHSLQNPDGISGNEIMDLNRGLQDMVWIATNDRGISYYDPAHKAFRHYTQNPYVEKTFSNNAINHLLTDPDNQSRVYIATDKGGLNIFNLETEEIEVLQHDPDDPNSFGSNNMIMLDQEASGKIWVSTWAGGLNLFDPETNNVKTYWHDPDDPYSIPSNNAWGLLVDSDNEVWIGFSWATEGGMAKYDRENDRFIRYKASASDKTISCDAIMAIYEDKYGDIWFLSQSCGIDRYNKETETFTNYAPNINDSTALSSGIAWAMYHDDNDRLWVATSGGLHEFLYEKNHFKRYRSDYGLPDDYVFSIQSGEDNNLWLGTASGLYRFNPKTLEVDRYTKDDGLQGLRFKTGSSARNMRGQLFFGGIDGFNVFYPSDIKDNTFVPPVVLTDFLFNNQSVTYKDKKSPLEQHISRTKKIILSSHQSTFGVEFAALNLSSPDKNTYQYQLIGLNDTAIYLGEQNRVYFNNLAPGDYTLHVQGANNDGYWNTEGASVRITVKKPFQKTALFYILLGLFVVALIVFYQRFRKKQHQTDKKRMEELLKNARKEAHDQKTQVVFQKQAIRSQEREDYELKWTNTGIAEFSDITSKYRNNLEQLSQRVITFLADYLDADQGEIFIAEDNENNVSKKRADGTAVLKYTGGYAANKEHLNAVFNISDEANYIVSCFLKEKQELQNGHGIDLKITSGLGEKQPKYILLTPIMHEEFKEGVILIGTYKKPRPYKREFIQKIASMLAVVIKNTKLNKQLNQMLKESQIQSEQLQSQQEELRQNLEELSATEEEFLRKKSTMNNKLEKLLKENKLLKEKMKSGKS